MTRLPRSEIDDTNYWLWVVLGDDGFIIAFLHDMDDIECFFRHVRRMVAIFLIG